MEITIATFYLKFNDFDVYFSVFFFTDVFIKADRNCWVTHLHVGIIHKGGDFCCEIMK